MGTRRTRPPTATIPWRRLGGSRPTAHRSCTWWTWMRRSARATTARWWRRSARGSPFPCRPAGGCGRSRRWTRRWPAGRLGSFWEPPQRAPRRSSAGPMRAAVPGHLDRRGRDPGGPRPRAVPDGPRPDRAPGARERRRAGPGGPPGPARRRRGGGGGGQGPLRGNPHPARRAARGPAMTLSKRVIPCLDVDAGRVVKGTRFVDLRDAGDPAELAARYGREGADELVFLDITATVEGRASTYDVISRTAA